MLDDTRPPLLVLANQGIRTPMKTLKFLLNMNHCDYYIKVVSTFDKPSAIEIMHLVKKILSVLLLLIAVIHPEFPHFTQVTYFGKIKCNWNYFM